MRFLSTNLQLNSLILNTLNNPDALDENQNVLNNLLNWLKSLSQISGLNQSEQVLIDALKDSVRKAKAFDILMDKKTVFPLVNETLIQDSKEPALQSLQSTSQETSKLQLGSQISPVDLLLSSEKTLTYGEEKEEQKEQERFFFYRINNEEDRWDYLANINAFISSYEHLMHLLIPNLALEVVKELHRFDCQNKILINEVVSYPSVLLQNLITKFLREAPGSNLFRRIRRIKIDYDIDLNFEQAVNIGERQNIKSFVTNYFNTLTEFLDPANNKVPDIGSLEDKTRNNLKQFSLGPASVEMRLTAIVKHVTESAFKDAEQALINENASLKTKVIYLATTQLICDFQNFLLNEPRILRFLEELKS